jgi:hypothetical protein
MKTNTKPAPFGSPATPPSTTIDAWNHQRFPILACLALLELRVTCEQQRKQKHKASFGKLAQAKTGASSSQIYRLLALESLAAEFGALPAEMQPSWNSLGKLRDAIPERIVFSTWIDAFCANDRVAEPMPNAVLEGAISSARRNQPQDIIAEAWAALEAALAPLNLGASRWSRIQSLRADLLADVTPANKIISQ